MVRRHGMKIDLNDYWLSRAEDVLPPEICEFTGLPRQKVIDPRSVAYWQAVHASIEARFWAQPHRPLLLTPEETHLAAVKSHFDEMHWRDAYAISGR
jgi:hypothetical protein